MLHEKAIEHVLKLKSLLTASEPSVAALRMTTLSLSKKLKLCIKTLGGDFLRGGPGMRLARFQEGEDGHEER